MNELRESIARRHAFPWTWCGAGREIQHVVIRALIAVERSRRLRERIARAA